MAWGGHGVPWAGGRLVCQEPLALGGGAALGPKPPGADVAGEPGETVPTGASATAQTGCPSGAQAPGTAPPASDRHGLPSPRAHTQDQSRKLKTSAQSPQPLTSTRGHHVSRIRSMATSHVYKQQAAGSRRPCFPSYDHHLQNIPEVESQDRRPL